MNHLLQYKQTYKTKIGILNIISDENFITNILFENDKKVLNNIEEKETPVIKQTIKELEEYFNGRLKNFTILMKPKGTEFQKNVWTSLQNIPYGQTKSYKDIAEEIGCPKGSRAIGASTGKNPIPIIIPCHRVIKTNGEIGGFSYGLSTKIKLLEIEGIKL